MINKRKRKLRIGRVVGAIALALILCFGSYKGITYILGNHQSDKGQIVETDYQKYKATVVIDPGHGGRDGGAANKQVYEKDVTLKAALYLGKELEKQNVRVIYTRNSDIELNPDKRTDLNIRSRTSMQHNADYFISLHCNDIAGNKASSTNGFELYIKSDDQRNQQFANTLVKHLDKLNYTKNRGIIDGSVLRVLKQNIAPSVLVEMGYIRGTDIQYLNDNQKLAKLSKALADGIMEQIDKE